MLMKYIVVFVTIFVIVNKIETVWIGEEYWTSIDKFGNILDGRNVDDFVTIDSHRNLRNPDEKQYIAFWIIKDNYGHHEAFGTARIDEYQRIQGTFLNRNNGRELLYGGFRILSKNKDTGVNPFEFISILHVDERLAISYRRHQPARIYSYNKFENFIGTASLRNRVVWGAESDSTIIKVDADDIREDYERNVEILIKNPHKEIVDNEETERLRREREEAERLRKQMLEEEERLRKENESLEDIEIHNLRNDNELTLRYRQRFN
uniref:Uncharacterized protein n=1 Tax=Parastrongyloides trichosuri TaxID=131310 RepID=A0A0N5A7A2_PARTI